MSTSGGSRVAQSFRHRDMGTIEATAPSFSVGVAGESHAVHPRRSTRKAARDAATRIAEEAAVQRRPHRSLARYNENESGRARRGTSAPSRRGATPSYVAVHGTKDTPIVLDDEDGIEESEHKPGAKVVAVAGIVASSQEPPSDFTCPICLDAPRRLSDIARISGCTHRFCFDCIDKWAETENKCPCCKERFRTIDRIESLPSSPPAEAGRRGKRKRATAGSGSNARASHGEGTSSPSASRRVNSRTVDDRNQQSLTAFPINAAIVEQILASFASMSGGPLRGAGQVMFGTSEDGRPQIRMIRPQGRGRVGVMEMYLPDEGSSPGNARGAEAGSRAARGSGAAVAAGASSPSRTARIRFSRSSGSGSVTAPSPSTRQPAAVPPPFLSAAAGARPVSAAVGARSSLSHNGRVSTSGRTTSQRVGGGLASLFSGVSGGWVPAGGTATLSSPGSGDPSNSLTIQLVARDSAVGSVAPNSRMNRHSHRRHAGSRDGNNDAGSSSDEPIIID